MDDMSVQAPGRATRWGKATQRVVLLVVGLVVLYLFAPTLGEVLSSWPRLAHLDPAWIAAAVLAESLSIVCVWWLIKLALRTGHWFAIATSQLAGNALSRVVPAGAAAGATLQYRMLSASGVDAAGRRLGAHGGGAHAAGDARRHPGGRPRALPLRCAPQPWSAAGGVDWARRVRAPRGRRRGPRAVRHRGHQDRWRHPGRAQPRAAPPLRP